ncbi:tungstate ABC transporter substrate-binding protein WtpA [Desulfurobacterium thermolithotrophum]|uniref:tungstate ABC transporter substrate-binding protein WtpA n=1 Tax=Desulfurobacterium thermolithotrophum TaxID=64160 RepID=UPI0013D4E75F|nr:tungstate ABC transporter substrate-binding protein WtpA [Desulfurobacterium thermolithotrophum]
MKKLLAVLCSTLITSTAFATEKTTLIIFHAGSLSVPFKKMEEEFEKEHPNIDVRREPSGSVKAIRKVTDLHKPCDVVASADYSLIPKMMFPKYTDHVKVFATNELVLCYTSKSKYGDKINSSNWYEILKKKDVKWGFSNPNLDPCGYRTVMMIVLASDYYKKPLYKELLAPGTNLKLIKEDGKYKVLVPKIFRTKGNKVFVRPKAVALLGLLESGAIDYAIEYKSVALQHGLKYVELPKEINLSDLAYKNYYSKVEVKLGNGKVVKGKPIAYGITTVKNAPHPKEAKLWEDFVTSKKGAEILKKCYQNPIYPSKVIEAIKK